MRNFAENCKFPGKNRWKLIKATELRKQVATYPGVKKLGAFEVSQTARFMGHSEAIHHGIYRQNQLLQLCVWMPQFLESAMGRDEEKSEKKKPSKKPWEVDGARSNERADEIALPEISNSDDMEIGKLIIFLFKTHDCCKKMTDMTNKYIICRPLIHTYLLNCKRSQYGVEITWRGVKWS